MGKEQEREDNILPDVQEIVSDAAFSEPDIVDAEPVEDLFAEQEDIAAKPKTRTMRTRPADGERLAGEAGASGERRVRRPRPDGENRPAGSAGASDSGRPRNGQRRPSGTERPAGERRRVREDAAANGERPARRSVSASAAGEGSRSAARRPAGSAGSDGERQARRRPAAEAAAGRESQRQRRERQIENGLMSAEEKAAFAQSLETSRQSFDMSERPAQRRPASSDAPARRPARQVSSNNRRSASDALDDLLGKEEKPRRTKKKKGNGLLIAMSALLVILAIVLAVCFWQLQVVRNGGSSFINDLINGGSRPSAPVFTKTVEANIPSEPHTENISPSVQEPSGEKYSEDGGEEDVTTPADNPPQTQPRETTPPTEAQTYQNDENGNLIIPAREPGSMETAPVWESVLASTGDDILDTANRLAAMYDYDTAIATLQAVSGYENNSAYTDAIASYEQQKSGVTRYASNNTIPHVFFHTLAVDTSRCFDESIAVSKQDGTNKVRNYNLVMTTVDEFVRIIEEMYRRDYVLVSIYDVAGYSDSGDGTMEYKPIYLPEGKKPFVLSVDDVSYYEYMEGHGFATKLVIGEDGKVTNEYQMPDGSLVYGSYDVMPILEDFIEAHPDFSYRGAKGIIALTGYEGIFGYRTSDYWFNDNCEYFNPEHAAKRESNKYYHNANIEQDKETARQVAAAIKAQGWLLASHGWGHRDMGQISYEDFVWDTDMWEREVEPLIGETDIIIYPKGADIDSWRSYAQDNPKYQKLKSVGFNYFCNVDSNLGWCQLGEYKDYFRMGRANLDGERMWEALSYYQNPEGGSVDRLSALFDTRLVFDWSRPTPVE